jgi:hypothetical protein
MSVCPQINDADADNGGIWVHVKLGFVLFSFGYIFSGFGEFFLVLEKFPLISPFSLSLKKKLTGFPEFGKNLTGFPEFGKNLPNYHGRYFLMTCVLDFVMLVSHVLVAIT